MRLKYDYSVISVMFNSLEAIIKSIYSYLISSIFHGILTTGHVFPPYKTQTDWGPICVQL